MELGKVIKMSLALACAYILGELAGKMKAFDELVDQHEDAFFADSDYATYEIRKNCMICKHKKTEPEEGDN